MNTEQVIELVNESMLDSLQDAKNLLYRRKIPQVAHKLDIDRHRWYEIATDVYKCDDGFIGVTGISYLYSENMTYRDCDIHCFAEEYKEVVTVTYKKK